MITSILINALGQALFESCGQALLIYITLQLFMQLFPKVSSKYRYDINYLGLVIICCWFLANLVKIYLHNATMTNYGAVLYNGVGYATKFTPTLLQQAEAFITTYAKYVTGLYMIGLMLHAFKLLGGLVHIHHIRKQNNLTQDSIWTAKVLELGKKLKIVKKVSFYFSENINIPLTIGHLKPIVIFPLALINNLDAAQVEAILLHELAHIKRHDYLLNILQCIMETILCFNPFVWLISKTIRTEREYCCDDMVAEDEECNNFTYAKALLIIAQQTNQSYALAMASTSSKKYPLLNRIKRLNTMKTQDSLPKFHLLVVLAVVAIGTLLAWGIPQYSQAKAQEKKKITTVIFPSDKFALSAPVKHKSTKQLVHSDRIITAYNDTAYNVKLNDSTINPSKKSFKIVINEDGKENVYNSVNDLPQKDKEQFLKENPLLGSMNFKMMDSLKFASMENFKMNPELKKQMEDMQLKMKLQFDNPEWHEQMEKMKEQFNNPEWNAKMNDLQKKMQKQFDNPEWKAKMEDMQKELKEKFDSPEWHKQMQDMQMQIKQMNEQFNSVEFKKQRANMQIQSAGMRKMMNSPEWKKQQDGFKKEAEEMQKKYNSPEWHEQMEQMQKKMTEKILENGNKAVQDSLKTAN
jgi:bla regulator protein BlaR1